MSRNISIVKDPNNNNIVMINDIIFKGKRSIEWKDVENYLERYVGEFYRIADTEDIIYIGSDLPDEYANSNYSYRLRGASAKANAVQGLPEIIEIAEGKKFENNLKSKHNKDAGFGWYRYESRFALPVFDETREIERYNVFHVIMLIRHAKDGKMYLYDILEIKKETSNLFQP